MQLLTNSYGVPHSTPHDNLKGESKKTCNLGYLNWGGSMDASNLYHGLKVVLAVRITPHRKRTSFDSHHSHISLEFIKKAHNSTEHLNPLLPPNTTHLLQPLDVGVLHQSRLLGGRFSRHVIWRAGEL